MMSSPFGGPPALPFDTADAPPPTRSSSGTEPEHLRATREVEPAAKTITAATTRLARRQEDMRNPPQGMHAFMRAYFHMKSADWKGEQTFPASSAVPPNSRSCRRYCMMDLNKTMPQDRGRAHAVGGRDCGE